MLKSLIMSNSRELVLDTIILARNNLAIKREGPVYPESPVCGFVCEEVESRLKKRVDIKSKKIDLPDTVHFVLIENDDTVYDPQHKQFIPRDVRDNLPDTLIIDHKNKDQVRNDLINAKVDPTFVKTYMEKLGF